MKAGFFPAKARENLDWPAVTRKNPLVLAVKD